MSDWSSGVEACNDSSWVLISRQGNCTVTEYSSQQPCESCGCDTNELYSGDWNGMSMCRECWDLWHKMPEWFNLVGMVNSG